MESCHARSTFYRTACGERERLCKPVRVRRVESCNHASTCREAVSKLNGVRLLRACFVEGYARSYLRNRAVRPNLSNRLRINFESPDREYPPCEFIESSILSRHGPPSQIREFHEEAAHNRYLVWKLELETIQLQCFRFDRNAKYFAEAIIVHPIEPKPAPSNPGVQRTPANGRR
jgi:hypothetical protein